MARSEEEIAKAVAGSDVWMDAVDPARFPADAVDDRKDLRQIGAALLAMEAAEQSLVAAVAQARASGRSWTDIANVLGVSRQAARQRFDARVEAAASCRYTPLFIGTNSGQSSGAYNSFAEYWTEFATHAQRQISEHPQDSGMGWIAVVLPYYDSRRDLAAPGWFCAGASRSDEPSPTDEPSPSDEPSRSR